jgi:hypothetical protein
MLEKLEFLKKELSLGTEVPVQAREQIVTIKDSLAVIQWFAGYIHEKISVALMEKASDSVGPQDAIYRHAGNGLAKAALIAVDDSMRSWQKLFEILSEQEDHFLPLLSSLEKIRKEILAEFPDAPRFVRPGLDEFLV